MISLTRRYHFPASHRLHSAQLSEAENGRLYGKCNNPFGHGHDYTLAVTVAGELDQNTGLLVPPARLDAFMQANILRHFAYRNINSDVPQFAGLVPTTENMARVIGDMVLQAWTESFRDLPVYPSRIHIQETERNSFELFLPVAPVDSAAAQFNESVMVHA